MKQVIIIFAVFTMASQIHKANAQTAPASAHKQSTTMHTRASKGDTVWVIINHIKADKRQDFEKFVHEIFWLMAKKLSTKEQRTFSQTRVLHPFKPEADGTYSYVFIMDPVVSGGDYQMENVIKKMYDGQKANEYLKMFNETFAGEQTFYEVVQSRY